MSRGLGKIERAILEALEKDATDLSEEDRESGVERHVPLMAPRQLLEAIHGDIVEVAQSGKLMAKYNAITRALRSLARKELVVSIKHEGRTAWTDQQGAHDFVELGKKIRANRARRSGRFMTTVWVRCRPLYARDTASTSVSTTNGYLHARLNDSSARYLAV